MNSVGVCTDAEIMMFLLQNGWIQFGADTKNPYLVLQQRNTAIANVTVTRQKSLLRLACFAADLIITMTAGVQSRQPASLVTDHLNGILLQPSNQRSHQSKLDQPPGQKKKHTTQPSFRRSKADIPGAEVISGPNTASGTDLSSTR